MIVEQNKRLKIGIEARLLTQPVNGIGRYIAQATNELIKQNGDFFLYSTGPISWENTRHGNLSIRTKSVHSRIGKMIWLQAVVPYWVAKDQLDVFWGTAHRLPRFLPTSISRIVTINDLVWKHAGETMRPLGRMMEALLMPQAIIHSDLIVAISENTAHDVRTAYPEVSDKIRVIYPQFTPLSHDQVALDLRLPASYILFVGTLEPRKNLYRLIKAFASLREVNKDISLVIAGGKGWGNVDVYQWINELGLDGNVIPVGHVTDEQLASLYANALFLAMPSLYEGFGLPIIEAMSYGKAVLTSNISSMPEIAGKAAFLVDPFDEHSIASGLKTLLNKAERSKFEAEAKKNAKRFTLQENTEKLWEIFQEAIDIRKTKIQRNHL